jgi:hypothetical protein
MGAALRYWQDGYGAFSVNPRAVDIVTAYIDRQYEHHNNTGFHPVLK